MPTASTTLHQQVSEPIVIPENHVLRSVLARSEHGDVKVWSSQEINWCWKPGDATLLAQPCTSVDLIIVGEPKSVVVQLVTDPALANGLFEAPISITLAHGLIWAYEWEQGTRFGKATVLDLLCWMITRVYTIVSYDRFHFSTVSIQDVLTAIDSAIASNDRPRFAIRIEQLYGLQAMRFDPHNHSDSERGGSSP